MSCNAPGSYTEARRERIMQCPLECAWQTHLTNAETRGAVCRVKLVIRAKKKLIKLSRKFGREETFRGEFCIIGGLYEGEF